MAEVTNFLDHKRGNVTPFVGGMISTARLSRDYLRLIALVRNGRKSEWVATSISNAEIETAKIDIVSAERRNLLNRVFRALD